MPVIGGIGIEQGGGCGIAPSATTGTIAKFTSPSTIGDSIITELSGNIGIGTTPGGSGIDYAFINTAKTFTDAVGVPQRYDGTLYSYSVDPSGAAAVNAYYANRSLIETAVGNVQPIGGLTNQECFTTVSASSAIAEVHGIVSFVNNFGPTPAIKSLWFQVNNYGVNSTFSYGVQGSVLNGGSANGNGNMAVARSGRYKIENIIYASATGDINITDAQVSYCNLTNTGGAYQAIIGTSVGYQYDITNSANATITNSYGIRLTTPSNAGTITNHYGIYLEDQTVAGTTNNYALYIAAGTSYTGGKLGIGVNNPGEFLQVAGSIKATGATLANLASSVAIDYSSAARLISWGADAATNGIFNLQSYRSDGSNPLTVMQTSTLGYVGIGTAPISPYHLVGIPTTTAFAHALGNIYPVSLVSVTDITAPTASSRAGIALNYSINPNANVNGSGRVIYGGFAMMNSPVANTYDCSKLTLSGYSIFNVYQGTGNIFNMIGVETTTGYFGQATASNITGLTVQGGNFSSGVGTLVTAANSALSNASTGSIGTGYAYRGTITNSNASGVITTAYGYFLNNITNTGTIGSTYGFYCGDITAGTQTNTPFSFYASDANTYNYFAGYTGIGVTAPLANLDVVGTTRLGDSTTNYTSFSAIGHQVMAGTARVWRDEIGELIVKKTIGARITDNTTEGTVDFADNCVAAADYKILNVQLNHDKDLTTNIDPHIHWFQASSNVPNWLLQYRWQILGGTKTTSWTNYKCNTNVFTYVSGTLHQISEGASIAPPGGTNISDVVQFRVCRDTANVSGLFAGADPLTGDASAISFDVHIHLDTTGSSNEFSA